MENETSFETRVDILVWFQGTFGGKHDVANDLMVHYSLGFAAAAFVYMEEIIEPSDKVVNYINEAFIALMAVFHWEERTFAGFNDFLEATQTLNV